MSDPVELAEAIGAVRAQLVSAQQAGTQIAGGQVLMFTVDSVELEFSGEIKRVGGGGVGVKFWVVSADSKAELTSAKTQKVKVTLTPRTVTGAEFTVSGGVSEPPAE